MKTALSAMPVKVASMLAGSPSCCAWAGTVLRTPNLQMPRDVRALLVGRKLLQAKLLDVELSIRRILRGYGLKVGEVSRGRFEARIRDLIEDHDMLATASANHDGMMWQSWC
ncbi:hypothetical protein X753_31675 [Mesorhizobium sp. LNJC399B00]|nr:hypothetical protein X753_31675 [Mesorhizobium sp. LNJC399B00]